MSFALFVIYQLVESCHSIFFYRSFIFCQSLKIVNKWVCCTLKIQKCWKQKANHSLFSSFGLYIIKDEKLSFALISFALFVIKGRTNQRVFAYCFRSLSFAFSVVSSFVIPFLSFRSFLFALSFIGNQKC